MNVSELLKEHAEWLKTAAGQATTVKATEAQTKFPEEQHERRMTDLKVRIEALELRKKDMLAAFDNAIAQEVRELESLKSATPEVKPDVPQKPKKIPPKK